jgi:cytochrome c peroxidase
MKIQTILYLGFYGLLLACSSQQDAGVGPGTQDPTPSQGNVQAADPAFREDLAAEYSSLPKMVLVAVEADASGQPIQNSVQVREVGQDATDLKDGESAVTAFNSGNEFKARSSEDDLGSSTASWAPIGSGTNFNNYQPTRYSAALPGYSYSYGLLNQFSLGSKRYYAYQRPGCTPLYCAPNPGIPGGSPGVGGPGYNEGELRQLLARYNVVPLNEHDYYAGSREQIALGERLFYDVALSANNDVSCSSCHIEQQGTTARYSIGPIGQVVGRKVRAPYGIRQLLIRNAPALYNLGHKNHNAMFWDSRVARSPGSPSGYISPAGDRLPLGLETPLAVQAVFPLVTGTEMGCGVRVYTGSQSTDMVAEWAQVMQKLLSRPDYRAMFRAAYPAVPEGAHGIEHLGNAIAAFESSKWRANGSAFDQYLRGNPGAMTPRQLAGATYFYGKGRCATCHSGPLQTDYASHAIAVPQWGPGAGDGPLGTEDWGLARSTRNVADRYKFRTPSLRNVTITGPWGHNGAYVSLREFVAHYRNPVLSHDRWNPWQVILPQGFAPSREILGAWNSAEYRASVVRANEFPGVPLNDQELDAILDFLNALTDVRYAGRGGEIPRVR